MTDLVEPFKEEKDFKGPYVLSGKRSFVMGRRSGKFEGEWDGFWTPPMKVADSVRVGIWSRREGLVWLESCEEFRAYPDHVEFSFDLRRTHRLMAEAYLTVAERVPGFLLKIRLANLSDRTRLLHLFGEVRVDLRRVGEGNPRNYRVFYDVSQGAVITSRDGAYAVFGSNFMPAFYCLGDFREEMAKDGTVADNVPGKTHGAPGVSCLEYRLRLKSGESKTLWFGLVGGEGSREEFFSAYVDLMTDRRAIVEERERLYSYLFERACVFVEDAVLTRAYGWAKANLEALHHLSPRIGEGYFAGLPWFTAYWGRDTGWILQAVDCMGDFEASQSSLRNLARRQRKEAGEFRGHKVLEGEIPNEVRSDGTVTYYSSDSTPLFALAACHNVLWSGNVSFAEEIWPSVTKALEWCEKADLNGDGFIECDGDEYSGTSWMDSYPRHGTPIEIQAMWLRALELASEVGACLELEGWKAYREKARRLSERISEAFWDGARGYFYDLLLNGRPSEVLTSNPALVMAFRAVPPEKAEKALSVLESPHFTTDWGVRSRSSEDPEYDPNGYHKGVVWGLLTGWTAWAEFSYDRAEKGVEYLLRLARLMRVGCLGAIDEVLRGDRPEPRGCPLQGWSSSVLVQGVVEWLLGVRPNALLGVVEIDPTVPFTWKEVRLRNLRVGSGYLDYALMRKAGGFRARVGSRGQDYFVTLGFRLPKGVELKEVKVDGKKLSSEEYAVRERERSTRVYVDFPVVPGKVSSVEVSYE